MYTLDTDTYSSIVQLLPIGEVNQLRSTSSLNSKQLTTLRNTDNFWKLRLEKVLDIQIKYIPAKYTWHQLYTKVTSGGVDLNKKLIKFSTAGDLEGVQLLIEAGADVTADNNKAIRWTSGKGYTSSTSSTITTTSWS